MNLETLPWTVEADTSPAERWEAGNYFFDSGDPISAAREFAELAAEKPENTEIRLMLARAYFHSAQLGRAERELRVLVDRNPSDAYTHHLLGRTLQRQSRHAEARSHLRLADALGLSTAA